MVESRANRTIEGMISGWVDQKQSNWDLHLPLVGMAYRSVPHQTTAATPNLLMLGREVTLPVDLVMEPIPEEEQEPTNYSGYTGNLIDDLRMIHQTAREVTNRQMVSQKRQFDKNVHMVTYEPGEVVWEHSPANKKGLSPKLLMRWSGPYVVVTRLNDVNYRIRR